MAARTVVRQRSAHPQSYRPDLPLLALNNAVPPALAPCPVCGQPAGEVCIGADGEPTIAHVGSAEAQEASSV